jgi:hypothetical protein
MTTSTVRVAQVRDGGAENARRRPGSPSETWTRSFVAPKVSTVVIRG